MTLEDTKKLEHNQELASSCDDTKNDEPWYFTHA
jgi:hypothetical protein